jgi:hypothetical protein
MLRIWREQHRLQLQLQSGRAIYLALHDSCWVSPSTWTLMDAVRYPKSTGTNAFSGSTEFFRMLIDNDVFGKADALAGPGLTAFDVNSDKQFSAENNNWCVTTDLSFHSPPDTPYLFTRNLLITNLAQKPSQYLARRLFRMDRVVVVTHGGQAKILSRQQLDFEFNPLLATNKVLRP